MFMCDDCHMVDEVNCVCGAWKVVQTLDYDDRHEAMNMFYAMRQLYRLLPCKIVVKDIPVVVEDESD